MGKLLIAGVGGNLGKEAARILLTLEDKSNLIFCATNEDTLKPYADMGIETHTIDYIHPEKLEEAFKNAEVAGIISMPFVGKKREAAHKNALDAAKKAGVKKIVYTSLCNADDEENPAVERTDHLYTENYIKELGFDYIFLRNSQFAEAMVTNYFFFVSQKSPLCNSMGYGHMAHVSRKDCAKALAFALHRHKEYDHATLNINGKEPLTIAEFVAIGDKETGNTTGYKEISDEENYKIFDSMGIPRTTAEIKEGSGVAFASDGMITFNQAIRAEKFNVCTDDFKKLTGDDPISVNYMFAHPDEFQVGDRHCKD
jgi:NAD(P)H dehydrogenase (quinone)